MMLTFVKIIKDCKSNKRLISYDKVSDFGSLKRRLCIYLLIKLSTSYIMFKVWELMKVESILMICLFVIVVMAGSKRQKTTGQASSSGIGSSSGLIPKKWEQPSTVAENDPRLYRQDWEWAKFRDSQNARIWDDEKNKQLSSYQDRKLEAKLWKWKMTNGVNTSVPTRVICERTVNVEEFRNIGIVQMFERLGWESVLDWCEDNTHRIYLSEVCEWLSTLKLVNKNESPSQWKLVGKTS
ncbi:hypothetical protein HanIR_Chr14g0713951 [Helianthus annuus]|nr:hypothetical protein HanIR_Chr14g0713951 [Helianthus annuus]